MGNSVLGMQFRTCENFGESTDFSLVLSPKFSQIQKPHRNHFDCDSQSESTANQTQIAESTLDSAESQNLNQKNSCEAPENSPASWCKKSGEASSSASADFLLEADKRGSPPKSEKRQLLGTHFKKVGGSGDRGAALLREETSELSGEGGVESTLDSAILQNQFFPVKKSLHFAESSKKSLPNTALIALGANLKNPIHTFKSLFTKLARNAKIHILATSPIYKNPPFGFRAQPFFYNATMMLATKMCLLEFYAFMFYLERIFGRARRRAFKNAPRALDIDIIFFNDIFMRSAKLNIPHPHWRARPSVVVPLLFQVNYKGF